MANTFRTIGVVSWGLGAWLLWVAFHTETAVTGYGPEPVANLQLMQLQQVGALLGALAFIQGTLCTLGAEILAALTKLAQPSPPS